MLYFYFREILIKFHVIVLRGENAETPKSVKQYFLFCITFLNIFRLKISSTQNIFLYHSTYQLNMIHKL